MNSTIKWYQSRTVWTLLVGIACHILGLTGVVKVSNDEQQQIVDFVLQFVGIASEGLGVVYRIKANSVIS